ncbi:MAG TPA: ChbG/HpnK family deacetylase [Gaiellaceae bacterium]|nr:ChbG/HpnK family deacetylase [Gaiellaceae bacterium]
MRKYLIVNADDLGLTSGVNRGIMEAHRDGILTSASLMVEGRGSEEAADLATATPRLSVGLHFILDGEGRCFLRDPAAAALEIRRQFDRFQTLLGRLPTHLDTHHHVHREPGLLQPLLALADEHGLPLREHSRIRHVPEFYGRWDDASHPEKISVEGLARILENEIGEGVSELGCHPGYIDDDLRSTYGRERELELATLTSPRLSNVLAAHGIELVNFSEAARLLAPVHQ